MDLIDLLPNEAVAIWDVTNGERLETYAVPGPRGSRVVCVNGAAAHKIHPGDLIIISAFAWMTESAARRHEPKVVFVDEENRVKDVRREVPGPTRAVA
jgi:aspartate 1-decarboxylase